MAGEDELEENELTDADLADASPDAVVGVRYGDLRELELRCEGLLESLRDAQIDLDDLIMVLQIQPMEQVTPHDVMRMCINKAALLMKVQGMVDEAEGELRERVSKLALPTIDMGNGRMAVQAGRRIPDHLLPPEMRKKK